MIVIPIILFFVILYLKLVYDFNEWVEDRPVNHRHEFIIVAICLALLPGAGFVVLSDFVWWFAILISEFMILFWFWFLFDGLYNLMRKRYAHKSGWKLLNGRYSFFYKGSNDLDDSVSDNLLENMKLWQILFIKIGGILLFTSIYFELWKYL